jgi:hypothetical protein
VDTAGRQHTRGLEGAMQARITNPEDARDKRASVGRRSSDAIGAAENQASHRSANESIGVVEGESAASAGAGMVTLAVCPLAIPLIALTAVALIPFFVAGLAIGLVIAVLVAPLRGCGGWGADSSACPALPRLTKWPAARSRCNATANAVKGMSLHAPRGLAQDRPRPRAERRTLLA